MLKTYGWSLLVTIALAFSATSSRAAAPDPTGILETVEIPVEAVLAPPKGFDDNDNIQLVIHGRLPNGCYILIEPSVVAVSPGKYRVKQEALKRKAGVCADPSKLPDSAKFPVPFQSEVSLGQLPAGGYEFDFASTQGIDGARSLTVDPSVTSSIDSLPYAAVTQVSAQDVVAALDPIQVTLIGVLNSSCSELDPDVQVVKYDDVTVLLPTVHIKEGVICKQMTAPFIRRVTLKGTKMGHHLIHVRSMSGKSLNRIVEVLK